MTNTIQNLNKDILQDIAKTYETPTYVYDAKLIADNFKAYQSAFTKHKNKVCYAVKANSNLSILKLLSNLGAGFDIVSAGELKRVIMAGGDTKKTIFSGVGKTIDEIAFALEVGIGAFDIESLPELDTIIEIAKKMDLIAPISIRFNPNIDAKTHPYISTGLKDNKFGLTKENAIIGYKKAKSSKYLKIVGINMHIGSQITDISVFEDALKIQAKFVNELKNNLNINLKHINVGGGIGVKYKNENTININDWADKIKSLYPSDNITLVMEPGRSIIANAGILLTKVLYIKDQSNKKFAIVDAAMNDYTRVALYQAYNKISNITRTAVKTKPYSIVGPICESSDFFAKNRNLDIIAGDLLAIHDTGAYGFSMSSNYNTRTKAAEVIVNGNEYNLIRRRETFEDLINAELIGDLKLK